MGRFVRLLLTAVLFSFLVLLEQKAADWAYFNCGWYMEAVWNFAIFLNAFLILPALWGKYIPVCSALLALALLLVPHQWYMKQKLHALKTEGQEVLNYLSNELEASSVLPVDLKSYSWNNPDLSEHFSYWKEEESEDFVLMFYVGSRNTCHFYRHSLGEWHYYDD